jgi:hypothetical protein
MVVGLRRARDAAELLDKDYSSANEAGGTRTWGGTTGCKGASRSGGLRLGLLQDPTVTRCGSHPRSWDMPL